jgi:hypothetical protein
LLKIAQKREQPLNYQGITRRYSIGVQASLYQIPKSAAEAARSPHARLNTMAHGALDCGAMELHNLSNATAWESLDA